MESALTISGIKLTSFDVRGMREKGLITNTEDAYIVSMFGVPVYKKVPFKAFFQKADPSLNADKFGVQINVPTLDYYFDYSMEKKDGLMRIISGDPEFVEQVNDMKDDKRKVKNFKYQIETAKIYLSKFLRYFTI